MRVVWRCAGEEIFGALPYLLIKKCVRSRGIPSRVIIRYDGLALQTYYIS